MTSGWILGLLICGTITLCVELTYAAVPKEDEEVLPPFIPQHLNYQDEKHRNSECDLGSPLLLTPLIEQNRLAEALSAAYVDSKAFIPDVSVESYSGYLTVNKEYNANLWFWFFPRENSPLILWLQGGLGVSSMYGLFKEIGPFECQQQREEEEGTCKMKLKKHSWAENHALLFIDSPVGSGFSFTDDERGYSTDQTTIGENLFNALQQFFELFFEYRFAPLTIAGESYAGKHIPSLAKQIYRNNVYLYNNIQGIAIGNGFTDPISLLCHGKVLRDIGLIDDDTAVQIMSDEAILSMLISDGQWMSAFDNFKYLLDVIKRSTGFEELFNYVKGTRAHLNRNLFNPERYKALHVGNQSFKYFDSNVYEKLKLDFLRSAKQELEEVLEHYKVMLYNGHLDIMVPYQAAMNTYKSLNFSRPHEFSEARRYQWYHNNKLAGYYRSVGNLLEVMVLGAGHMVPLDQPAAAHGLISAFARGVSLNDDTGYLVYKTD